MRQRNTLFGALSLAVAGAAIGAGAIASSNAMADSSTPPDGATMQVVTLSSDGTGPVSCEFDDISLPTLVGGGTPGDVVTGHGDGGVISVTGSAEAGSGPSFTIGGDGSPETRVVSSGGGGSPAEGTPVDGSLVVSINAGDLSPADVVAGGLPDGAVVLDAADARPGTAEECAAVRATFTATP